MQNRTPFAVGDWLVEPDLNRISTTSQSVYLRKQLMEVLVHLAELQGKVATLDSLHDDLWRGKVVSSGTIYNCIADLRQALSQDGKDFEYIETIPKAGYRLAAPVVAMPVPPSGARGGASVAVLPLFNRSGDPQIEYLCDGIAEEVLHRLSRIEGLRVISAATLKGEKLDPRVVGLRFAAQTVLTGRLQASENRLRLAFRLENVASGETLWTDRYDQSMANVFEVQDAVAAQVVLAICPALGISGSEPPVLEHAGTKSLEALNAFLLGRYALSESTRQNFDDAIRCFERAVSVDPTFGRAHYRLYLACHMKCRYFGGGPETLEKERVAGANAQKYGFRPPVPWIHIHRRLYRDSVPGLRALALEAIDKIRSHDPEWGSFGYEQLTWVLSASGFFVATRDFAKHMFDSPSHNFEDSDADEELPEYYAAMSEFDEAIRLWSAEIQKDPRRPMFRYSRSALYSRTGQFQYAERDIDALDDGQFLYISKALYYFWREQTDRIAEYHARLRALSNIHPSYLVLTNCMLGEMDAAIEQYAKATSAQSVSFIDFGPMRVLARARLPGSLVARMEQHRGFQALLAAQGINDRWRAELRERLNEISAITGITVMEDPESI
ncbi:MAG: winged helix-turn-helix domain-containing protein [Steroidobacteraceae bacterium]